MARNAHDLDGLEDRYEPTGCEHEAIWLAAHGFRGATDDRDGDARGFQCLEWILLEPGSMAPVLLVAMEHGLEALARGSAFRTSPTLYCDIAAP